MTDQIRVRIADLPVLTEDERDDAAFRAKDLGWAALMRLFDEYAESQKLNYKKLGDRIKRSRSQVQRWLASPFNLNLTSLGLLAEGLNADLMIIIRPRKATQSSANYCHPSEAAMGVVLARTSSPLPKHVSASTSPTRAAVFASTSSNQDEIVMAEA